MRTLSKFAVIFLPVCLLLAVILLFAAYPPETAAAENAPELLDFEIVQPEEGYFPVSGASHIAANSSYIAVYDSPSHAVYVTSPERDYSSSFLLSAGEEVTGLWLSRDTLLLSLRTTTSTEYYAADLAAEAPSLVAVALDVPADISYIVADEHNFYAKSDSAVAVYPNLLTDAGLTLGKLIEDRYVAGKYIFAANERVLYFFAQNYTNSEYFIYSAEDERITDMESDTGYIPASVAYSDCGLVAARRDENILVLSAEDATEVILDTGILYSADTRFAATGDTLYVTEGEGVEVYTLDVENGEAVHTETLAMRGSSDTSLSSPADIAISEDGMFVADAETARVLMFAKEGSPLTLTLDGAPTALASDGVNAVYAASEHTLYALTLSEDGLFARKMCAVSGENILDIALTEDGVILLTDSSLYTFSPSVGIPKKAYEVSDGVAVSAAQNDVIYILSESGVHTLSAADGGIAELLDFRTAELLDGTDIAADFAGDLFVSFEDEGKIVVLDNSSPDHLTVSREFTLSHPVAQAHPTAFVLYGGEAYFTSSTCFVGKADVGAVTEEEYVPPVAPDTDSAESITFATVTADTDAFDEPSRFDTMVPVKADTVVLRYDGASSWEGYTYVYFNGRLAYIADSLLVEVAPSPLDARYTLPAGAPVLLHPAAEESSAFSEDMVFSATDDAAMLDGGKWVRLDVDGIPYFAVADDLLPYVEPDEPIDPDEPVDPDEPTDPDGPDRTYGRASADRPGGLVGIYTLPDIESTVATEVVDGTRMEVIGEEGDFWLVAADGETLGYILKSELELEGLTTVQIVSIVLAVAVAVTGAVIFVVIWQARKKEKE